MSPSSLMAFLGASIILTIAPGPDNLFVIAQGISAGRRSAVITAWGMCSGITLHTLAAALGISAVFYSSPVAFSAVRYAGAAYLAYLAFRVLRPAPAQADRPPSRPSAIGHFRRGFLMNVLNPKVALFFLAFLPQFVARDSGGVPGQMVVLGMIFMAQALVIFSAIAWFSGTIGDALNRHPRWPKYLAWTTAAIFLGLAINLAVASM